MTGSRGERGERGQQGDHGQSGDTGLTGDQGKTGITGAAGAEGRHGAAGAAGAAGTAGAPGLRGPRGLPFSTKAQLVMYVGIVGLFIYGLHISSDASQKAQSAAKRATDANIDIEFQAFSNCVRNNITSGVIAANSTLFEGRERVIAERIANNLYPVLDCKATAETGKTVRIAPAERDKYVAVIVETGRAPIIADSKVVGSRKTVLEGIETLEQAGSP